MVSGAQPMGLAAIPWDSFANAGAEGGRCPPYSGLLAMKELVRGVYGSDSNEAQAIGYKKKSERKRPRRSAA